MNHSKYESLFEQYKSMYGSSYITASNLFKKIIKDNKLSSSDYLKFISVCRKNNIYVNPISNGYDQYKSPISSIYDMDIFSDFKEEPVTIIELSSKLGFSFKDIASYFKINNWTFSEENINSLIESGYEIADKDTLRLNLDLIDLIPAVVLKNVAMDVYKDENLDEYHLASTVKEILFKNMDKNLCAYVENKILNAEDQTISDYELWVNALDKGLTSTQYLGDILNKLTTKINDTYITVRRHKLYSLEVDLYDVIFKKEHLHLLNLIKVEAPVFWMNTAKYIYFQTENNEKTHKDIWYADINKNHSLLEQIENITWILYDETYSMDIREKAFMVGLQNNKIDSRVVLVLLKEFKTKTNENSTLFDICVLFALTNIKTMSTSEKKEVDKILPGITTLAGRKKILKENRTLKNIGIDDSLYDLKTKMVMLLTKKQYNDYNVELPVLD